jgi:hypothetical protein
VTYSEALEQQLTLLDFAVSPAGRDYCRAIQARGRTSAPSGWDWDGMIREGLGRADPYWVAPDICELLEATSPSLPAWTLTEAQLPGSVGFVWFGRPIRMEDLHGAVGTSIADDLCGVLWLRRDLMRPGDTRRVPAIVLTFFGHLRAWPGMPPNALHRVVPVALWWWPFGESHAAAARQVTDDDGAPPPGEVHNPYHLRRLAVLGALWAFLGQRLLVTNSEGLDRAARRRIERGRPDLRAPLVRVVTLRRREAAGGAEAGGTAVDWSCRWVVRGHWRQQACGPAHAERRPLWVLPHVKGPEGKPLKVPRATVFAVVR